MLSDYAKTQQNLPSTTTTTINIIIIPGAAKHYMGPRVHKNEQTLTESRSSTSRFLMAIFRICTWRSQLKFAQIVLPSVLTSRKCVYYRADWTQGQLPSFSSQEPIRVSLYLHYLGGTTSKATVLWVMLWRHKGGNYRSDLIRLEIHSEISVIMLREIIHWWWYY